MKIPVVTLHQPWAQFIAEGWKTIETRTHERFKSLEGKRIIIHAGAHWDKNWEKSAGPYLTEDQISQVRSWQVLKPRFVCSAHVEKHSLLTVLNNEKALINCYPLPFKRYGLFLQDIQKTNPLFIKGHQGIWYF